MPLEFDSKRLEYTEHQLHLRNARLSLENKCNDLLANGSDVKVADEEDGPVSIDFASCRRPGAGASNGAEKRGGAGASNGAMKRPSSAAGRAAQTKKAVAHR